MRDLLECVGQRSFGPLLLVPSLIVVSPMSGIPGVPTLAAVVIAVIAVQMLIGRRVFWLPQRALRRCLSRRRLEKAINFLGPVAVVADRLVRPRLTRLTHKPFSQVIAASCILVAVVMPPLELVPMANSMTAAAVAAFGLALVAHDGLLAVVAFAVTAASLSFAVAAVL